MGLLTSRHILGKALETFPKAGNHLIRLFIWKRIELDEQFLFLIGLRGAASAYRK